MTFENLKKSIDEGKDPVIALKLEDDSYLYCGIKTLLVMDEKEYVAFHPLHGDYPDAVFFRINRSDEDDVVFDDIEDDAEYFEVVNTFDKLMNEG